jgi:hypothetical protein
MRAYLSRHIWKVSAVEHLYERTFLSIEYRFDGCSRTVCPLECRVYFPIAQWMLWGLRFLRWRRYRGWNVGKFVPVYTALQPSRRPSSYRRKNLKSHVSMLFFWVLTIVWLYRCIQTFRTNNILLPSLGPKFVRCIMLPCDDHASNGLIIPPSSG